MNDLSDRTRRILLRMGVADPFDEQGSLVCRSPIDGSVLGRLRPTKDIDRTLSIARTAAEEWRDVPAPVRGGLIREFGGLLRKHKEDLGDLVAIETGKIRAEGAGEVQEMIDICDLSVGLSRQLFGRTIVSERPGHRMMEQWHPLGVVGVISAFNFPVAVWSWNAAVALVCGNAVVWKPSEKALLTALACQELMNEAIRRTGAPAISGILSGGPETGEQLARDTRIALLSATGSTRMGREVAAAVSARLGKILLELGGNNAAIVTPHADLDLAVRGIVFSAVGTAGQRCTTLRRLIVHERIKSELLERLISAYRTLTIGSPLDPSTLVGPLIDRSALEKFIRAIADAQADGGKLLVGGGEITPEHGGCYVQPAIVDMPSQTRIVKRETFGPLLYVLTYSDFDEAIRLHNEVPQGLSSSIFTLDLREAERFLSATGSDCGIANVNIGPSGAEIGGAFGGEKDTGGGRESGSDAWRNYMRRATNTINFSTELPLAQGIEFGNIGPA